MNAQHFKNTKSAKSAPSCITKIIDLESFVTRWFEKCHRCPEACSQWVNKQLLKQLCSQDIVDAYLMAVPGSDLSAQQVIRCYVQQSLQCIVNGYRMQQAAAVTTAVNIVVMP